MVPLRLGFVPQWNAPCERASCLFFQGSRAQWNREAALTQPSHHRRAPRALFDCVTFVRSKPARGLPVNRALGGTQSICTFPWWECVCPHTLWKWDFIPWSEEVPWQEWSSLQSESVPAPCTIYGCCGSHPCPSHAQLGSKGQCQQCHCSSPQPHPPCLCLHNPTINHGDAQAVRTLIIWLRGNLNTSFGGKTSNVSRQQNPRWNTRKIQQNGLDLTHTYSKNTSKEIMWFLR